MKKTIIFICLIIGFTILIGWNKLKPEKSGIRVSSSKVNIQKISESILSSGNLIYDKQVQIRSEVMGVISHLFVTEGQEVNEGQILLELDSTTFEAEVSDSQAAVNAQSLEIELLEEESRELVRQLKLSKKLLSSSALSANEIYKLESKATISKIKVKAAKEMLNRKRAVLKNAKAKLEKSIFRAPMTGVVTKIDSKVGETVIAGTTNIVGSSIMTLVDKDSIIVKLKVDEADITNVIKGQKVEVFTSANPKNNINGVITKIGTTAQREGTNQGLYYHVDAKLNDFEKIFAGMSCRAEIIVNNSEPEITVPISAIQFFEEIEFVWLIKEGLAHKQIVITGVANDIDQVVTGGLNDNDWVVTGSARTISSLSEGVLLSFDGGGNE